MIKKAVELSVIILYYKFETLHNLLTRFIEKLQIMNTEIYRKVANFEFYILERNAAAFSRISCAIYGAC